MRSSWKGSFTDFSFLEQFKSSKVFNLARSSTLTPVITNSLDIDFQVYNGQKPMSLAMRGFGTYFKAGSFVFTKSMGSRIHSVKKKSDKKKK